MHATPSLPPKFWLRVFAPFAAGYFLSYAFRSVNATIATDLAEQFALGSFGIGLMTSAYFLSFSIAQLPIGVALDRYGPRRTELVLLFVAAVGGLSFALATQPAMLILGRALIGLGVAACLMASFKSFVDWAPPETLPALHGWVMACGSAGAIASTTPVLWGMQYIGWRGVFLFLAAATGLVALWIGVGVPEPSGKRTSESLADSVRGIRSVFNAPVFWSITPLAVAHQASYLAIQSLWAGPWLRDVGGLAQPEVAGHLLGLAVAMVVGYSSFGWLSQRLAVSGGSILGLLVVANVLFTLILLSLAFVVHAAPLTAWIAFGFVGAAGMLSYVILTAHFDRVLSGRVTTALNLLTFLGAFIIQAGMGAVIQAYGSAPEGYRAALILVALAQTGAMGWLAATSEWRRR